MQSFRQFLEEQEQQILAQRERKDEKIERWTRCVSDLADQITHWLEEDDARNVLEIERRLVCVSEEPVGTYQVTSLIVKFGIRAVVFAPVSCMVIGPMTRPKKTNWLGRVNMIGASTYRLYYAEDYLDSPSWVAVNDEKFTLASFTREFFEAAMVELFS